MSNKKNLANLLNEAVELRNLNIEKLSELTDIPVHYLAALTNNDFSKLPPTPYLRGYLVKIAEALRIDANLFLKAYKEETALKTLKVSGVSDKLPTNRFLLKTSRKKRIFIVGTIFVLIAGLFILKADDFLGAPKIEIISPAADNLIVRDSSFKLLGRIGKKDKLAINGEEIATNESGYFEKDFSLQPGINTVEFKVKRFLGKETKIIRQVIYQYE
jgi:hypothetical protein